MILMRGASRDVTARKQAEQETQRLRQEIAHAGRVSMMGQLASALAHEINQPLGAILRNAEAAELFLQNRPSRTSKRSARSSTTSAPTISEPAASSTGCATMLKRQTLDTRMLDVAETRRRRRGVSCASDAATRQVTARRGGRRPICRSVRGDRVHLQQVLLNLILNGMDALERGEPAGSARRRERARRRRADRRDRGERQPGTGIPPRELGQVFDPFFTTKPDGMGMGLPISRTIIEAHGGRLWAENSDGGGATFRFTLPIARGGRHGMSATPTHRLHRRRRRVLSRTATSRTAARERVRGEDVRVGRANFSRSATPDAPGCVVADLRMPGMNGLELQAALARTANPLPMLFLTGQGDIPSSVRAMRDGAEDFLEKRAPKAELLDAVKRALARDAREREARDRQRAARALRRADRARARSARPCRARAGSTSRSPTISASTSAR